MFGFLIGFLSLLGLIAVLKGHRRRGCGRGWSGHGGWVDGPGHHHHRGGPKGWLRYLFRHLDTTPGQEKEIAAALDELVGRAKELRGEGRATRDDVAALIRTESLDEDVLAGIFTRHDDRLREMQQAFGDALARVHQALDPEQRERLAKLLESGRTPGLGGPYRSWA